MSTIAAPGSRSADGLRPVNLRSDLGELADLIELVFSPGMDRAGREAVRDMRLLGRSGLAVLPGMSDIVQGMGQGYVWVEQGRLVGNISLFASNRPRADTWLIANVGVHPGYRRRGIGDRLVAAAVAQIRRRGGRLALLQVDCDNVAAQRLYKRRGFHVERAWTHWRRDASIRALPAVAGEGSRIAQPRRGEWQAEFDLAQRLRPVERGGLGWQRPLRRDEFQRPLSRRLNDWLNMRGQDRLAVRSEDDRRLLASLWIDHSLLTASTQLTLFADEQRQAANVATLLASAVRRHGIGRHSLLLEHPADEQAVSGVLRSLYFRPLREVLHMRQDLPS